ncbi:divergent polysaccharide deacetylase family protein [Parahaliea maris]|uniref:Divergent polysaccharide deacetylase family protein n=1 Tax=Parahaliea maris TaxID=2716870 RepID=A0A5C9A3D8_9GAMM|nr:divergent polysaccharide deacetylase family protein [Parahaliea maris]TXS93861.1 divergent polysaccharide deacetylase family protein [Parahaliea maris]
MLAALPASAERWHRGECSYLSDEYQAPRYTLVLIIDDIGNQLDNGRAAVELPGRLNYAVLPHTPHGPQLAELAHRYGKEVLLHQPMSNLGHKALGRGGLTPELDRNHFHQILTAALASVPHVRGLNNHMGSDLTRRRPQMEWLMAELSARQLYFVDSRTDKGTVAAVVAGEASVPHLSRQVFLDNQRSEEAIAERFDYFIQLARERGLAVAIGHPYPETIAYLQRVLPKLTHSSYRLALVSEVLDTSAPGSAAAGP